MSKDGVVTIHGREYKTVALRVSEFRDECPIEDGWAIRTDLESAGDPVIVRAAIVSPDAGEVAVGYAEERRDSSQINRTSALENCETSAIGRALAAAGYGGSEYASANEVENAIHQQKAPPKRKEPSSPIDINPSWPASAALDYQDRIAEGVEAFGESGFSERVVRLLTHGDYNAKSIAEIDFKRDGRRLYDDLGNILEAHDALKGDEE
jgi:hypothetical protein